MTSSDPHAYAADLLRLKLGIYGRAVRHIDVEFHWANRKPVSKFMREQAKDFAESLKKLPRVKFDKRNRRIEVSVVSSQFFEDQTDKRLSKTDLKHGHAEYLDALKLIGDKVKFGDEAIDVDQLIQEAARILSADIPSAAERKAIDKLASEAGSVSAANTWRFDSLAEMKEYWSLFHRNAKLLLVTPIFWTKELGGPHGTEVGADVLREFARWHVSRKRTSPLKFLPTLLKGWGVAPLGRKAPELGLPTTTAPKTVLKWHSEEPALLQTTDEIALSLAFAIFKLRGRCPDEITKLAQAALKRRKLLIEKGLVETAMPNWESNLKMIEIALKRMNDKNGLVKGAAELSAIQSKVEPPRLSPTEQLRRIDFKSALEDCYEDLQPHLETELVRLRKDLLKLPAKATNSRKLKCVEKCVKALNAVEQRDDVDNGIDTDEREILCDLIYRMGGLVGLDSDTDYIDEWREW